MVIEQVAAGNLENAQSKSLYPFRLRQVIFEFSKSLLTAKCARYDHHRASSHGQSGRRGVGARDRQLYTYSIVYIQVCTIVILHFTISCELTFESVHPENGA